MTIASAGPRLVDNDLRKTGPTPHTSIVNSMDATGAARPDPPGGGNIVPALAGMH